MENEELAEKLEYARIMAGEICYQHYNRTHLLFNPVSRETIEINCKSWRCPKHQVSWLFRWQTVVTRELAYNPVNKWITLTCASKAEPAQLNLARQIFARDWRENYGDYAYLAVLEFTSETRLPHMHILARGKYVYQKVVSGMWKTASAKAGIRASPVVDIRSPRSQDRTARYALKYALNGAEKGQAIPMDWRGRKITYSKNFFQYCTAKEHWQSYLLEKFGDRGKQIWQVKTWQEMREKAANFKSCDVIFDINDDGQAFFEQIED